MAKESTSASHLEVNDEDHGIVPFSQTLLKNKVLLERDKTSTLQINVGLMCNQTCTHCHLNAGPTRKEMMDRKTMEQVIEFAGLNKFDTIDITGGAPELHHDLPFLIKELAPLTHKLILRSNLSALYEKGDDMMRMLKSFQVTIVSSFPSLNQTQTEAIRGKDIFDTTLQALIKLNSLGYGEPDSGLELDLVVNPSGAFLSPSQESLEKRFKKMLNEKWGIRFNQLFSFANVPLGRFMIWLKKSGNYEKYLEKLTSAFNPSAIKGVMCRTLLSVSWDGYLYDCDFNQAAELYMANKKTHISEIINVPEPGTLIAVGDHCYTCTAGAGFT